jgi:hypothetical protein
VLVKFLQHDEQIKIIPVRGADPDTQLRLTGEFHGLAEDV